MRRLAWAAAVALLVLCTRSLVYALNPSPLALHFQHQAGGPVFPLVVLVSLAAGLGVAAVVLWAAALGVRERRLLESRPLVREPRLSLGRVALRAVVLFAAAAVAFTLVESTLHWRAGLGWHGIDCLVGPVHRDALPILAALAALASALGSAVEHVVRWVRRTVALLRRRPPRLAVSFLVPARRAPLRADAGRRSPSAPARRRCRPADPSGPAAHSRRENRQ